MDIHTEQIDIAGIDCTLHIAKYDQLMPGVIVYRVTMPAGASTAEHKGILTEDNGTLRCAAIQEAEAILRAEYAEWESTLA